MPRRGRHDLRMSPEAAELARGRVLSGCPASERRGRQDVAPGVYPGTSGIPFLSLAIVHRLDSTPSSARCRSPRPTTMIGSTDRAVLTSDRCETSARPAARTAGSHRVAAAKKSGGPLDSEPSGVPPGSACGGGLLTRIGLRSRASPARRTAAPRRRSRPGRRSRRHSRRPRPRSRS